MAVATMTAPKVKTPKRFTRGDLSRLGQELPDDVLRLRVAALSDLRVPDDALLVDDHGRGPRPVPVAPPDGEVIVLHHRVLHAQLSRRGHDLVVGLLPGELRRVHPDDRESLSLVLRVPVPQLRDHVLAVVAAVGPELHEHHASAKVGERQRRAVDPRSAGDLGSDLSDAYSALGAPR